MTCFEWVTRKLRLGLLRFPCFISVLFKYSLLLRERSCSCWSHFGESSQQFNKLISFTGLLNNFFVTKKM